MVSSASLMSHSNLHLSLFYGRFAWYDFCSFQCMDLSFHLSLFSVVFLLHLTMIFNQTKRWNPTFTFIVSTFGLDDLSSGLFWDPSSMQRSVDIYARDDGLWRSDHYVVFVMILFGTNFCIHELGLKSSSDPAYLVSKPYNLKWQSY